MILIRKQIWDICMSFIFIVVSQFKLYISNYEFYIISSQRWSKNLYDLLDKIWFLDWSWLAVALFRWRAPGCEPWPAAPRVLSGVGVVAGEAIAIAMVPYQNSINFQSNWRFSKKSVKRQDTHKIRISQWFCHGTKFDTFGGPDRTS